VGAQRWCRRPGRPGGARCLALAISGSSPSWNPTASRRIRWWCRTTAPTCTGRGDRLEVEGGIVYSKPVTVSRNRRWSARQANLRRRGRRRRVWQEAGAGGGPPGRLRSQTAFLRQRCSTILRQMPAAHFPTAVYFLDAWHLEYQLAAALSEGATTTRQHWSAWRSRARSTR